MSLRYKGATISATAPVTTGGEDGTAPGAWTLEQQSQLQAAGLWPLPPQPKYIEDVFSTYLYTGNGSTQTITNGIDLAGKGGLVWSKDRFSTFFHQIASPTTGVGNYLIPSLTNALITGVTNSITSFNSNGYSIGANANINGSGASVVSWTFRKQPKFFDVVTYTGNGVAGRTVAHSLGSAPGCMIIKPTSTANDWFVYHQSLGASQKIFLNLTDAASASGILNNTAPTSTNFTLSASAGVNASGETYVAYLFAHNAGGFGATGTDNVVSCGSFTTDASGNATVNLGYEPQWVMEKASTGTADNWNILDVMRGASLTSAAFLRPNTSSAEAVAGYEYNTPTATGFNIKNHSASTTYIYIAIRRGPMKVPTDGTKVFSTVARTGTSVATTVSTGIIQDLTLIQQRSDPAGSGSVSKAWWYDRLRGGQPAAFLTSSGTDAEGANSGMLTSIGMNTYNLGSDPGNQGVNVASNPTINWNFTRAPSFFDEVCYTGTGVARTINHNLTVAPEFIICKTRSVSSNWQTQVAPLGPTYGLPLSLANPAFASTTYWNDTAPTASVFTVGTSILVNNDTVTYVAYLFATCPGVSKVGSYTGTGATQTIACGFAGGARFVLIKRTDSTGDWYVWDTARGMVSGTDPSLLLNSTAAEVNANSIYTATTGFQIVSTAAGINASGGSYIFLAIA